MRRIWTVLGIVGLAVVFVAFLYPRYKADRDSRNGQVYSGSGAIETKPLTDTDTYDQPAAASGGSLQQQSKPASFPAAPSSTVQSRPLDGGGAVEAANGAKSLAGGDSISPNPPNGAVFAGSGNYQLYRQGNLTWRLNTKDGTACILFATDAEWRKPKVYRQGCGTRGRS